MYNLLPQSCGQFGPVNPTFRYKRIKDYIYDTESCLGRGNFSCVYPAWREGTEEQLAVKVVPLSQLTFRKLEELLEQETAIISELRHPNIIRCHEVLKSSNHCYIITELCEQGNLEKTLQLRGPLPETHLWPFLRDIHQGLKYLASRNIVHRDLKTANIFLKNGTAKIADFGFAVQASQPFYDMHIGSPLYMSPEGFLSTRYSLKTDVWAFGVVIYELLHGKTIFQHCLNETQLRNCFSQQVSVDLIRPDISSDLKELILACLQVDETRRISIEEIENLPYMQKQLFSASPNTFLTPMATYKRTETALHKSLGKTDHQVAIIIHTNQPSDKENLHFKKHHQIRKSINDKGKGEAKELERVEIKKMPTLIDVDENRSVLIVSGQKMIKGNVSFNESIGLIHFCRIGFKFIQEGLGSEPMGMVGALIIQILEELLEKVILGQITYDVSENKSSKEKKLKKVLQEYLQQYKNHCTSNQPVHQLNLQKVEQVLTSELARIENSPQSTPLQCYIAMTFLLYAEYLRWGSLNRNYRVFAQNGNIDTCLDDKNIPNSLSQYQEIKRKYQATLAA